MKIKSIQKVIKVGSSLAVTIPARDAKYYGIKAGEELEVQLRRLGPSVAEQKAEIEELAELTQQFVERHQKALDNLSQR